MGNEEITNVHPIMKNNKITNVFRVSENRKRTAVLPIRAASVKFFTNDEEIFEDAKTSPPFVRRFHINSMKQDMVKRSAFKTIFTILILSVSLAWIGEFSKIEPLWLAGSLLGIALILAVLAVWGLSIAKINMSEYYVSLFARFPGNGKTRSYINELEKLGS